MTSDKEIQLLESLADKDYREALAFEHVNTTLAVQIRNMRENHEWEQEVLANRLGKHQEAISRWENPDYGRHSITTLKALASAFDVALLIKFIPFSELVKDMVNLSETRLSPPSFDEEQRHASTSASVASSSPRDTKDTDPYDLSSLFQTPNPTPSVSTESTTKTGEGVLARA